ncbi:CaiB/BaiF CoA transferase family protein [Pararhizobium haloflavum]|uniref:CaiB/BaiF CoA transferase family protein n=1 Tax=Pararhizobium haloflavum TaxID=2037914 RepID=UPI000C1949CE|nr:CaiB/BaiF CoA-transferase family protein [Pararhizobium haloflavum]
MTSLPLSGVQVLDFTTFLSGPFATQLLGDLGATVIKVEPAQGDSSRAIPSHEVGGDSGYYLANNRNKKSVGINLKTERGRSLARELALKCDVVIENFRPGVAARLGLDSTALRECKPELIWASISGFGQTGPWKDRPAYDMIVQALSGAMSLTGEPGGNAVRLGVPMGDIAAGLFSVIGILSALHARKSSGQGTVIDVAMLDCMLSLLSYQGVYSLISGQAPQPQGARHDSIPTYRSFRAGDGREFVMTANTERMWQGVCNAIGQPDLSADPRYSDGRKRLENRESLWRVLETAFSGETARIWVDRLQANDVPAAVIRNVAEALADARKSGRGMICSVETADARFDSLGAPIKFDQAVSTPSTYPPAIGEHNVEVLGDLIGLTADEAEQLMAEDVLHAVNGRG